MYRAWWMDCKPADIIMNHTSYWPRYCYHENKMEMAGFVVTVCEERNKRAAEAVLHIIILAS